MIKIGELDLKTEDPKNSEGNYNRWSHRFNQQTFKAGYKDIYDIGKLFIYLFKGNDPICYYKADIYMREERVEVDPVEPRSLLW